MDNFLNDNLTRIKDHGKDFPAIWLTLLILLLASGVTCLSLKLWLPAQIIMWVALALFVYVLIRKPMSIVYGLIGTSGNVSVFFLNFFFVSFIFALIYYAAFFSHAKISYDVNQPYISFDMGRDGNMVPRDSVKYETIMTDIHIGDTVIVDHIINGKVKKDTLVYHTRPSAESKITEIETSPKYQSISFGFVLRNTIITSLIQEPTDFFAAASTYNEAQAQDGLKTDKEKARLFNWILIFQILISWIFFGVFISILYNKFRYES